jgi:hypothetical protein
VRERQRQGESKGSTGRSKGAMAGASLHPVIVTCVRRTENRANLASNCRNGAGIAEAGWEGQLFRNPGVSCRSGVQMSKFELAFS